MLGDYIEKMKPDQTQCRACALWDVKLPGCLEGRDRDEQGNPIEMVDCHFVHPLTCEHCGYTGPEVARGTRYVGGMGDVQCAYCPDTDACWERWEKKENQAKGGNMEEKLLTVREVSLRLRLENPKTVYHYIAEGWLTVIRIGPKKEGEDHRRILITEHSLRKFIARSGKEK